MQYKGRWYVVNFVGGGSMNISAMSEEEARNRTPNYCTKEIKSVRPLVEVKKKDDDI